MTKRAIIVGAGAGGLSAAVDLATAGWKVDVFESNAEPGGKMHQRQVGEVGIDGGPTFLPCTGFLMSCLNAQVPCLMIGFV